MNQPAYQQRMAQAQACQSRREALYLLRLAERHLRQEKALVPATGGGVNQSPHHAEQGSLYQPRAGETGR